MKYLYKEFCIKRENDYFYLYCEGFENGFSFSNFNVDFQICGDFTRIDIQLDCFDLDTFILTHAFFLNCDNYFNNVRFRAIVAERDIEYLFSN